MDETHQTTDESLADSKYYSAVGDSTEEDGTDWETSVSQEQTTSISGNPTDAEEQKPAQHLPSEENASEGYNDKEVLLRTDTTEEEDSHEEPPGQTSHNDVQSDEHPEEGKLTHPSLKLCTIQEDSKEHADATEQLSCDFVSKQERKPLTHPSYRCIAVEKDREKEQPGRILHKSDACRQGMEDQRFTHSSNTLSSVEEDSREEHCRFCLCRCSACKFGAEEEPLGRTSYGRTAWRPHHSGESLACKSRTTGVRQDDVEEQLSVCRSGRKTVCGYDDEHKTPIRKSREFDIWLEDTGEEPLTCRSYKSKSTAWKRDRYQEPLTDKSGTACQSDAEDEFYICKSRRRRSAVYKFDSEEEPPTNKSRKNNDWEHDTEKEPRMRKSSKTNVWNHEFKEELPTNRSRKNSAWKQASEDEPPNNKPYKSTARNQGDGEKVSEGHSPKNNVHQDDAEERRRIPAWRIKGSIEFNNQTNTFSCISPSTSPVNINFKVPMCSSPHKKVLKQTETHNSEEGTRMAPSNSTNQTTEPPPSRRRHSRNARCNCTDDHTAHKIKEIHMNLDDECEACGSGRNLQSLCEALVKRQNQRCPATSGTSNDDGVCVYFVKELG